MRLLLCGVVLFAFGIPHTAFAHTRPELEKKVSVTLSCEFEDAAFSLYRVADLSEDMAAEQKARSTYDNILLLSDDPDVNDVIKFLRAREVVHFQRFGEAMEVLKDQLDRQNIYAVNPALNLTGN